MGGRQSRTGERYGLSRQVDPDTHFGFAAQRGPSRLPAPQDPSYGAGRIAQMGSAGSSRRLGGLARTGASASGSTMSRSTVGSARPKSRASELSSQKTGTDHDLYGLETGSGPSESGRRGSGLLRGAGERQLLGTSATAAAAAAATRATSGGEATYRYGRRVRGEPSSASSSAAAAAVRGGVGMG